MTFEPVLQSAYTHRVSFHSITFFQESNSGRNSSRKLFKGDKMGAYRPKILFWTTLEK